MTYRVRGTVGPYSVDLWVDQEDLVEPEPPTEPTPKYPREPILIEDTGETAMNGSSILSYESPFHGLSIVTTSSSGDGISTSHDGRYVAILDDHLDGIWRIYDTEKREFLGLTLLRNGAVVMQDFLWCHKSHAFYGFFSEPGWIVCQRVNVSGEIENAQVARFPVIADTPHGRKDNLRWRTAPTSGAPVQYLTANYPTMEPLVGGGEASLYHYGFAAFSDGPLHSDLTGDLTPWWLEEKALINGQPVSARPHNSWIGINGIVFSPSYLGSVFKDWEHVPNRQHLEHWISFAGNDFHQIEPGMPGEGNKWTHQSFDKAETSMLCLYGNSVSRGMELVRFDGPMSGYTVVTKWTKEEIAHAFGNTRDRIGFAHGSIHNGVAVGSYQTDGSDPKEVCLFQIDLDAYEIIPLIDWYEEPAIMHGDPNDRFYALPRPVCAPGFMMWHTGSPVELRSIEL